MAYTILQRAIRSRGNPIESYSGIRGISGETLTPKSAYYLGRAFGVVMDGRRVFVARDTRPSGLALASEHVRGLRESGCSVIYLGVCPTPSLQHAVATNPNHAGVMITASHNPVRLRHEQRGKEWNGFKFYSPTGLILGQDLLKTLLQLFHHGQFSRKGSRGSFYASADAVPLHVQKVLNVMGANSVDAIKASGLSAALDPGNGAGAQALREFLEALEVKVAMINDSMDGIFARQPEPTPANLVDFQRFLSEKRPDIGAATDVDADRIRYGDNRGRLLSEEDTAALAIWSVLRSGRATTEKAVVLNILTSKSTEYVAHRYWGTVYRTPVGELKVIEEMQRRCAVIGGEGSGKVIYPPVIYGADTLSALGLVLDLMVKTGKSLSWLKDQIPEFHMIKSQVLSVPKRTLEQAMQWTAIMFQNERIDYTDGIKVIFSDRSWLIIRPSNTEPKVRIVTESTIQKRAQELQDIAIGIFHELGCSQTA